MRTQTVTDPPRLLASRRAVQLARARMLAKTGRGREVREQHELPILVVANGIGASQSTLWRWENGECQPTGDAALRWVELLDELRQLDGPDAAA